MEKVSYPQHNWTEYDTDIFVRCHICDREFNVKKDSKGRLMTGNYGVCQQCDEHITIGTQNPFKRRGKA